MSITIEAELTGMQKVSEAVACTLKGMRDYARPCIAIKFTKAFFILTVMLVLTSVNLFSQTINTPSRPDTVLFTDFLSNSNKIDTISVDYKLDFFNFFKMLDCLSGAVYFSGDGFFSAVAIRCKENEAKLKTCFERCVKGSKFTLDNCAFFRDGGQKPVVINKVVLFQ